MSYTGYTFIICYPSRYIFLSSIIGLGKRIFECTSVLWLDFLRFQKTSTLWSKINHFFLNFLNFFNFIFVPKRDKCVVKIFISAPIFPHCLHWNILKFANFVPPFVISISVFQNSYIPIL